MEWVRGASFTAGGTAGLGFNLRERKRRRSAESGRAGSGEGEHQLMFAANVSSGSD